MSIALRKFNAKRENPYWWRRYFWSKDEFSNKSVVYRAVLKAKRNRGRAEHFFWHHVCVRAASYHERNHGHVPHPLLKRPIPRDAFAFSSPEIHRWLRRQAPAAQQRAAADVRNARG